MEILNTQCDSEQNRLLDAKDALEEQKRRQRAGPSRPSSPTKPAYTPSKSPTKKFSPTKEDLHRRTLPSKRLLEDGDASETMDVDEPQTPMKVRKLDFAGVADRLPGTSRKIPIRFPSPTKKPSASLPDLSTLRIHSPTKADGTPSTLRRSSRLQPTPSKTPLQTPSRSRVRPTSPSKSRLAPVPMDVDETQPTSSSAEEDEVAEQMLSVKPKARKSVAMMRRRSRFVYADHHQWIARDPRMERIRKAGELAFKAMCEQFGPPAY